jgi:serine/threonine protein kinase
MELVKGEPITDVLRQPPAPAAQRLELFVAGLSGRAARPPEGHHPPRPQAVERAGLDARHDAVVKVIDFGVAKALGQELTDNDCVHRASPSSWARRCTCRRSRPAKARSDVDTRSDIYSLGVLLYELLTGTTPFDKEAFRKAAQDEIRRIIREEEPPRPSTRLSESKDSLASISAQRHTEPAKLTKLVRGELDWIVMKALEKEPRPAATRPPTALRRTCSATWRRTGTRRARRRPVIACGSLCVGTRRSCEASVIWRGSVVSVGTIDWMVRDRTARQAKIAGQVEQILSEVEQLEREQKWAEALPRHAAPRRS